MQRSTWTKFALVLLAGALLYTLAGFLLVPALVKREIATVVAEQTGRNVSIARVAVNPFTLTVELSELSIIDPDGTRLLSIAGAEAQFHASSLLAPGWNIRNLVIDAPHLSVPASGNGRTTLERLTGAISSTAAVASSFPAFDIAQLRIRRGELQLAAARTAANEFGPSFELVALELDMTNLGTRPEQRGEFTLTATLNRSTPLTASGSFTPSQAALDAAIDLTGLDLAEIIPAMQPGNGVELETALIAGEVEVHIENGRMTIPGDIALRQISLVDRASRAPVFTAPGVIASQVAIESSPLQASVETLRFNAPYLRLARGSDGTLHGFDWLRPLIGGPGNLATPSRRIEFDDGRLDFTDLNSSPSLQMSADRVHGSIGQQGAGAEDTVELSLQGRVMTGASAELTAKWLTVDPKLSSSMKLTLGNLDAVVLSPYFAALAGREIAAGILDLEIEYAVREILFDADNEISVRGFQLAGRSDNPDAIDLQLELAVALLTDANGRINVTIPVPSGRVDQNFHPAALLHEAFGDFISAVSQTPFTVLGEVAGWSGPDLGRVDFEFGSAALTASSSAQLASLAIALEQRPRLGLKVGGRFDPVADRDALARQQMRLHVALASTAGPPGMATVTPLVFADPKVIAVLDEFAATRLSAETLAAIGARFPDQDETYYDAVFEALVANENVSATALMALARYRAQSIINQLVAAGVESDRLRIGTSIETVEAHDRRNLAQLEVTL